MAYPTRLPSELGLRMQTLEISLHPQTTPYQTNPPSHPPKKRGRLQLLQPFLEQNFQGQVSTHAVAPLPISWLEARLVGSMPRVSRSSGGVTFSGCPGTEDFVLFAITSDVQTDYFVSICVWKQGRWKYKATHFGNSIPFSMSAYSSPVPCNGSFYCVSDNGRLGVFNPEKETWNVLTRPKGFSVPTFDNAEVYLIEFGGGIAAVVGGNHGPRVLVFCLDFEKMAWQKITSMEPRSIFIGPKASFAMDVGAGAMRGRVYSPRFWGEVEALQAEMEVCEGQLFFVTKARGGSKSEGGFRNGNIVSCSLRNLKMDKYFPSYEHLHCAWYNPEISSLQQVLSVG